MATEHDDSKSVTQLMAEAMPLAHAFGAALLKLAEAAPEMIARQQELEKLKVESKERCERGKREVELDLNEKKFVSGSMY